MHDTLCNRWGMFIQQWHPSSTWGWMGYPTTYIDNFWKDVYFTNCTYSALSELKNELEFFAGFSLITLSSMVPFQCVHSFLKKFSVCFLRKPRMAEIWRIRTQDREAISHYNITCPYSEGWISPTLQNPNPNSLLTSRQTLTEPGPLLVPASCFSLIHS